MAKQKQAGRRDAKHIKNMIKFLVSAEPSHRSLAIDVEIASVGQKLDDTWGD